MKFEATSLAGAFLVSIERLTDERGDFGRIWGGDEMEAQGLNPSLAQASLSFNLKAGTLRGMHFQLPPHQETKLIRCTRGAVYDVIVDIRPDSPTYRQWFGAELTDSNDRMQYVPEGFAHGFITLEDAAEVTYYISQFYQPEAQRGLRYDDPAIGIRWPREVAVISERDRTWPDLS